MPDKMVDYLGKISLLFTGNVIFSPFFGIWS